MLMLPVLGIPPFLLIQIKTLSINPPLRLIAFSILLGENLYTSYKLLIKHSIGRIGSPYIKSIVLYLTLLTLNQIIGVIYK